MLPAQGFWMQLLTPLQIHQNCFPSFEINGAETLQYMPSMHFGLDKSDYLAVLKRCRGMRVPLLFSAVSWGVALFIFQHLYITLHRVSLSSLILISWRYADMCENKLKESPYPTHICDNKWEKRMRENRNKEDSEEIILLIHFNFIKRIQNYEFRTE